MLIIRKKLVNSFFFYGTIYVGDKMKKNVLILMLFLSIFILFGCKKKEEEKEVVKDDIRELKEEEINDLMGLVEELYYFDINPAKSFKTTDLTNQEVLLWASFKMGNMDGVEFKELEELASKYLDFSLEPEHIICVTHFNILDASANSYLYDPDSKSYKKNDTHTSHSENGYYSIVYNNYVSSSYKNGDYIITVNKLFSSTDYYPWVSRDFARNYYASYLDAKYDKNPVLNKVYSKEASEKIKTIDSSKLVKYTYTFRLKNDNYVLKSYQIEQ